MSLPELRATGPDDHFAIYVRDHLAGSAGGLSLLRRALGNNLDTPYEASLRRVLVETRQDREDLERVAAHNDVRPSRAKQAAATVAEFVARGKLNGSLLGYSPLGRLWELEQLGAAVATKTDLWTLLVEEHLDERVPADVDARRVLDRCRSHVDLVEQLRRRAGREAFAGPTTADATAASAEDPA